MSERLSTVGIASNANSGAAGWAPYISPVTSALIVRLRWKFSRRNSPPTLPCASASFARRNLDKRVRASLSSGNARNRDRASVFHERSGTRWGLHEGATGTMIDETVEAECGDSSV